MISRRISLYLVGIAATAAVAGLYFSNALATLTEVGVVKVIDYYAQAAAQDVTIKKGESQTIPVDIIAPSNKAVNLKLYVSEPEGIPPSRSEGFAEKFSEGISVQVDKKDFSLRALSEDSAQDKRDTFTMSVSAGPTASTGVHTFTLTLSDGRSYTMTAVRVNVVD